MSYYLLIVITSLKGHSYLKHIRYFAQFGTIFYNLKNVKNTHGGISFLVKLQVFFTKSNTPLWVFFCFLYFTKLYQIAQCITLKINRK